MKKIVFSNYDDINNPFYGGGGAFAIHETAKRLAKYYKVTVITGNYKGAKDAKIDGVKYKRIGTNKFGPKISQLLFQLHLPLEVIRSDFDIWFESFTPPFSTTCLQFFTRKPVVGLIHMLSGIDMERKYKFPFTFFEKMGLRTYKYFIVTNPNDTVRIQQLNGRAKIFTIPNGVEIFNAKKTPKKNQILFLGRIEVNQKGIDLLLKAFKKILKKKNINLVVAGNGDDEQIRVLKDLIIKNKIQKNVILKGRIKREDIGYLFAESKCIVVPSRFETFSLTSLEALANGLPLVHFDIHGLSWIEEKSSKKVKPFDINKLSETILEVVSENNTRNKLTQNSKFFAKKFSHEKNRNLYMKLINEIL